ncbi:MAG: exodeoxyribonuclease III [Bacteroidetes bacterium CG23_combo_of_CG06-09_8_20_14_all_32_9]|nr:MAG: exodeoxyribonuclease III [Bacteroidetes bacterium CG23_combo_of_CG06-09_8_20_14_all_32_9]
MKVFSYNINGIRSALSKGLLEWVSESKCDLLCFQELKATTDQFDVSKFTEMGYFPVWNSAERKGYSGTALLSKQKPDFISTEIGISKFDKEGRLIRTDFGELTHISVYVPSGSMGDIRQEFKMEFLSAFYNYIKELLKTRHSIIISGDFNICHKPIDINNPEKHNDVSGFLPEEREWLDNFISLGLIDSFRVFNSQPEQYSWWSYRQNSRNKNLGWRIDYNFVNEKLKSKLKSADILRQVVHSDHCPVMVEIV